MSLYCQHLFGKSLLISTVQDIHSLCGLLTCGINGISLKIPVAVPTHGRPACGRGRRAFAAAAPAACGRFGCRWQREPGHCPGKYCPCGRAAGWLTTECWAAASPPAVPCGQGSIRYAINKLRPEQSQKRKQTCRMTSLLQITT